MNASIKILRAFRALLLTYGAFLVAFEMTTRGYVPVFTMVVLAFMLSVVGFQTRVIRRQRRIDASRNRPRPDYSAIARLEREVYGETFRHEGAPADRPLWQREWCLIAHPYASLYGSRREHCKECDREHEHRLNLRWTTGD